MSIPDWPDPAPVNFSDPLRSWAEAWFSSDLCPLPCPDVLLRWRELIDAWAEDDSLPIFVRRARNDRGHMLQHISGRVVVPTDNSIAHYSFPRALAGEVPTLDEVRADIESRNIPCAMILKTAEKKGAVFCTGLPARNLNDRGWKLCHIDAVAVTGRGRTEELGIVELIAAFKRVLDPGNMFLIPKQWSGLGEIPEVIQAARRIAP